MRPSPEPKPRKRVADFCYVPVAATSLDLDAKGILPGIEIPGQMFRPGQRALLLEDRADFREVLSDYLISRSFQVTSVPSGVEGLKEIMNDRFDLILCDMMMPLLGGEYFYWAVTRVRPAAGQRFIFFTGHKNDPKLNAFFARVNATVLFKPFRLDALDEAMREVTRKLS